MYRERPVDPADVVPKVSPFLGTDPRFVFEFFARFTPVPTDEYGSLEIDLPTDDADPGTYCFVMDQTEPLGCESSVVVLG